MTKREHPFVRCEACGDPDNVCECVGGPVIDPTVSRAATEPAKDRAPSAVSAPHGGPATSTPGPWSVGRTLDTPRTRKWDSGQIERNNRIEAKLVFANFTADDEGRSRIPIAECFSSQGYLEAEANARLIAAAPDLLAACKELVSEAEASIRVLVDIANGPAAGFAYQAADRLRDAMESPNGDAIVRARVVIARAEEGAS